MLFLQFDSIQNLKVEKIYGTLIILFYGSSSSPQLQRLIFYQKHKKNLFNLSEAKISLDVIIKSINFQSNESPGNYSLRTEFHKRFSNKLIKVMKKIL